MRDQTLPKFDSVDDVQEMLIKRGFKSQPAGQTANVYVQQSKDNSGSALVAFRDTMFVYRFDRYGVLDWQVENIDVLAVPACMVEAIINETVGSLQ